jgi:hypothetical protein
MQKSILMSRVLSVLMTVVLSTVISCATRPDLVGRWREIGKSATLEFHEDGTFNAVDNQGMAVSGIYTFGERGNITFEITLQDSPPDIVQGKYTVRGDELTLVYGDPDGSERYKRER